MKYLQLFLALIILSSCRDNSEEYEPCHNLIRLDEIKPASSLLSWIPYQKLDTISFYDKARNKKTYVVESYANLIEIATNGIEVTCPLDSTKYSPLEYTLVVYNTHLTLIQGIKSGVIGFDIVLSRYLGATDPRIEKYADVIEVYCNTDADNQNQKNILSLAFPVSQHEYNYLIPYNKNGNIFSSLEPGNPFIIYYSNAEGILGFKDMDGQIWMK